MMDDQDSANSTSSESHSTSSESIANDAISSEQFLEPSPSNPGLVSRVAGGAYNTTATLLGGAKNVASNGIGKATWITGAAFSKSFCIVKGVGSYVLPARLRPAEPKDKSD